MDMVGECPVARGESAYAPSRLDFSPSRQPDCESLLPHLHSGRLGAMETGILGNTARIFGAENPADGPARVKAKWPRY